MDEKDFNKWAFCQCVVNGHQIDSVKDENGKNIKWINTTTKEEFVLPESGTGDK